MPPTYSLASVIAGVTTERRPAGPAMSNELARAEPERADVLLAVTGDDEAGRSLAALVHRE